jgi:hypothetical protein
VLLGKNTVFRAANTPQDYGVPIPEPDLTLSMCPRAGLKCGRTSAPRLPHALQTNRGSMSDSLTSSGYWSAGIAIEWLHLWSAQKTKMPITPLERISPNVIFTGRGS